MAREVFKAVEIQKLGRPIVVDVPKIERDKIDEEEEIEEEKYTGPTVEEIEAEIEEKRLVFEENLAEKRREFQKEIDEIKAKAEEWAFNKVKQANEEYEKKMGEGGEEKNRIIAEAQDKADRIMQEAEKKASQIESEAYSRGFNEGRDEGYQTGREEVDRLVERLKIILSSAISKRNEVIDEAEAEVVDIIITIARKVVKIITDEQKMVVVENVKKSLEKLRGRAEITIQVNTEDLQKTAKYKKEFIDMLESIEHVRVLEDNTVERGGCIISTDFGSIDARIASQLSEIESKIKEISPQYDEHY